jgi:site-specific DNA recombinase
MAMTSIPQSSPNGKRAVTYARVSGDDRSVEGRNLDSQQAMCREYCDKHGYQIVAEVREDDRGASGAAFELPGLTRVRDMAARHEFDVLVVRELDRLSRSLGKQLFVEEELKRCGVRIEYVLDAYPDTPEGGLHKNIRAVIAEYERLKIRERIRRGLYNKALRGQWPGNSAPAYGYRYRGKGRERTLEIDPERAEVVRHIFRWYLGEGSEPPMTVEGIACHLNALGIPWASYNHPNIRWRSWHRTRVWRILTSRRYIGEFDYGGVTVTLPHLAIVDRDTFERAQRRIAQNKERARHRRARQEYLLAGRFRCTCGHAMGGHYDGERRYYMCTHRLAYRHVAACQERMVRADRADALVWAWLVSVLDERALAEGLRQRQAQAEAELAPLRQQVRLLHDLIAQAEREMERYTIAYGREADEGIAETLLAQAREASRRRESLIRERERLEREIAAARFTPEDSEAVLAQVRELRRVLEREDVLTFEEKRAILEALQVEVRLAWRDGERVLVVNCALPAWEATLELHSMYPTAMFAFPLPSSYNPQHLGN